MIGLILRKHIYLKRGKAEIKNSALEEEIKRQVKSILLMHHPT